MIKINAQQLTDKLSSTRQPRLPCYLLLGKDPYLQQYAQTQIQLTLKSQGFTETVITLIDNQTDWSALYQRCQSLSLFADRILFILTFAESGLNAALTNKLEQLIALRHPDMALLISLTKLTKAQENSTWLKSVGDDLLWVNCITPEGNQLQQWLTHQASQLKLTIAPPAVELLCYYYEGNLLALAQLLDLLALLYPDGKLSYEQVRANIDDVALFTPYHWIDALLTRKAKRALHILQQLQLNETEPPILLRTLQREVLNLINLQRYTRHEPLKKAFDHYRVWQSRRPLLSQYLESCPPTALYQSLAKLTEIELAFKQNFSLPIWDELAIFAVQFMGLTDAK